jgi:protein-L-isoaspartate(D-aspartate) O-methyltransferase
VQTLIKVRRTARGFDYEELRPVRFVPLLEGMGKD